MEGIILCSLLSGCSMPEMTKTKAPPAMAPPEQLIQEKVSPKKDDDINAIRDELIQEQRKLISMYKSQIDELKMRVNYLQDELYKAKAK